MNACSALVNRNSIYLAQGLGCALIFFTSSVNTGSGAFAQVSGPSPAPASCVTCHAGLAASYSHAAMRNALETPGADPILAAHPNLNVGLKGYSYFVRTQDGESTYTVSNGAESVTLPIHWIFGQHSQTWVLEKDGDFYESLVSYFQLEQGLANTPGDGNIVPHNLDKAIGRKISAWEVMQCFNCHATNATDGTVLTLDRLRPGLGCERCHEGSEQHSLDAGRGNFSTRPKALKQMNAADAAEFCGQCHRTWDAAVRNHWHGPADVRFQPYRLENSKCFTGNDRRISCLACHDPHQPVNKSIAFYDLKCLACHGATGPSSTSIKTCPVSKMNCVSCHMPQVKLPDAPEVFTDHQIRIVRAGEPYPD